MERLSCLPSSRILREAFEAEREAETADQAARDTLGVICMQLEHLDRGDLAGFLSQLAPEVEIEIHGPPEMPYLRRARGVPEARRLLERNLAALEPLERGVLSLAVQGETLLVLVREKGKLKPHGSPYHCIVAVELTCSQGKLRRLRQVVAHATG